MEFKLMTTPLFSINAAAEVLERDRRTITKALRHTPPDGTENSQSRWRLKTILDALAALQPAPAPLATANSDGIDPVLAKSFATFDAAYDRMVALPTLEKRRAAARALAPQIASMDRMLRAHGRAVGAGDELADLRGDKLFALSMRGFERPCSWNSSECWQFLDLTADTRER
jgi:hypothetical protein